MKECILDSKNYLHLKTYNYIINISNPWTNLKPFHIIVIRQACQSRFTGLSASRTGLTQTFSYYCHSPSLPVPIHGTVCFPYWTYSNLFKFLVIRQACQSRFTGLSASRTGLTQTFSYYCYSPSLPVPIHGTVCFPYWTYSNLFNSPDARDCWDFLFLRKFKQA